MKNAASIRLASLLTTLALIAAALVSGCASSESWTPPELVATCENGVAVPNPRANPDLVRDCATMLAANEAISPGRPTPYRDPSQPIAEWNGVVVAGEPPRATELTISGEDYYPGTIPTELGHLDALKKLDIRSLGLSGEIPAALGNLSELESLTIVGPAYKSPYHQAQSASLSPDGDWSVGGEIPPELGKLDNLKNLTIAGTLVEGRIPSELGYLTSIEYMDLSYNYLSGPIPQTFGGLRNLKWLNLEYNALSGTLPAQLGRLSRLRDLDVSGNQISGEIPSWIGRLRNLEWLNLGHNELTGEIPMSIGNLTALMGLELYGNNLTGRIPSELGRLRGLRELHLSGNRLAGTLPKEIANIENLRRLSLSRNLFGGPVPGWVGDYPHLNALSIEGSGLTGCLPSGLRRYGTDDVRLSPGFTFCDEIDPADYEGAEVFGEVALDTWQGALNAGDETVIAMSGGRVRVTAPPTGAGGAVLARISAERGGCMVGESPPHSLVACLTANTFQTDAPSVAVAVDGAALDISMRMHFREWQGALGIFTDDDMQAGMRVLRRDDSGSEWAPVSFGFEFNFDGLSRVWADSVSLPGEFAIVYDTEPMRKRVDGMRSSR